MNEQRFNQREVKIRRAEERGHADFGWLDSYHTFSFGEYFDPAHMGFRSLRVINEDRVAGGGGFPSHPHRDMEIISVAIDGAFEHKDSMGNGSVIRRGDVQKMSAGTGVVHSEFNASSQKTAHFLQIWIVPAHKGLKPGYEQISYKIDAEGLTLIGSSRPQADTVVIHQDVELFRGYLTGGRSVSYVLKEGRGLWIQVISGSLEVDGVTLKAGDGASVETAGAHELKAGSSAEFLLFDLK